MLPNEVRIKVLEQKIYNLDLQIYESEITLSINSAVGDPPHVIKAQQDKLSKQKKALELLESMLKELEG